MSTRSSVSLRLAMMVRSWLVGVDCASQIAALLFSSAVKVASRSRNSANRSMGRWRWLEDLGLNHVEVDDAAAGEDQRDAGQGPFDGVGRPRLFRPMVPAFLSGRGDGIGGAASFDMLCALTGWFADLRGSHLPVAARFASEPSVRSRSSSSG